MSDPTPASPTGPSRKRKAAKWGLFVLVGTGVVVAAAPFLLSTSWMNGVIRDWLRENVDRDVEFASLDVSWTEGIRLSGVVVHDEAEGQPPVFEAPLVVLRAPVLPMLARRLAVSEFVVQDAVVRVAERGESVNAKGVIRLRKPKRARPAAETPDAAASEPLVLPDMDVPLQVRNLTLVLADEEGREARRPGISFDGRLVTREGPTTFDLVLPAGGGGTIRAKGRATLFDPDGVLLAKDRMLVEANVAVQGVDAKQNADVLRLFLPERPAEGVVDATLDAFYDGKSAKGALDLHVRGVALDAAVGKRSEMAGDDLAVAARWEWTPQRIDVRDLKVRAEGLAIDGRLAGDPAALDGRLELDADLARMTAALRTLGFPLRAALAGRAKGDVTFTPSPSRGTGTFTLTGFRAEGVVEGNPPVVVDSARIGFVVAPSADEVKLESFELSVADLSATATGARRRDGTLDLHVDAKGDLGGLLDRVRDLGLLPSGFELNGRLDASVDVAGRPAPDAQGKPATAYGVTVQRLVLGEDDVRIEVKGTAAPDGTLDLAASGSGDLGKLLGRAQSSGLAGAGGPSLDAVRGRFEFEASAKGPASAVVVTLPRFRLDGDLAIEASGAFRPTTDGTVGAIEAKLAAKGRIDDALVLARRLGLIDRELRLEGTLSADAAIGGTVKAPQVPSFRVNVASPALSLDAAGSVSADRRVQATAKGSGDLARLADFAVGAKFADRLPPVRGRLAFDVEAAGSTDEVALPRFSATLRDGPADVDVQGALTAVGRLTGSVSVDAALDSLARFAKDGGWIDRELRPGGKLSVRATLAGTRNRVHVPSADVRVTGPVELTAQGSMDAAEIVKASAEFHGPLQPLLDLATQWTGGAARKLPGSVQGSVTAEGPRDRLLVTLPRLVVEADGATLDLSGMRDAQGAVTAKASVRGPIAGLLASARAFDAAKDLEAAGNVDATLEARLAGGRATGSASAAVLDLAVTRPAIGTGGTFREPRAALTLSSFTFDLDARRLEPMRALVQLEGAKAESTLEFAETPGAAGAPAARIVRANGSLVVEEAFVRNHPELFSDVRFERVEGPFRFAGDVGRGRAAADGWTGGAELSVTKLVAPHVTVDQAKAVAKIEGGAVVLDPIEGTLNGGPVTGTARIGLVGEEPEHTLDLKGRDVALGADLAPLVARASPLFAIGEHGKTGGKASVDLRLKGRGLDAETLKRTLTGGGTLGFREAYVESKDWIGMLLSLVGSSGRLDLAPVDVPFDVRDGRVRTGDVAMDAVGLLLRMGGDVGLDGKLDYALRLRPKGENSVFSKYASLLDAEGFLPLRLEGRVGKPKLRAPDVKDVLKGKLDDLLGGVLGDRKDEKKDEGAAPADGTAPKDDGSGAKDGGGRKKRKRDGREPADEPPAPAPGNDVPPPPAPRGAKPPAGSDEPPPPPPPAKKDGAPAGPDDPPPPPPPSGR